jgi:hypothetical protein
MSPTALTAILAASLLHAPDALASAALESQPVVAAASPERPAAPGPRLFFAPSARPLARGEAYVGLFEIAHGFGQIGVTDRLSVGAGAPLVFSPGSRWPVLLSSKLAVVDSRRLAVSAGVLHTTIGGGLAYAVATADLGGGALTVGRAVGYAGGGGRGPSATLAGFERPFSARRSLLLEGWVGREAGVVIAGVRRHGRRIDLDLGMMGLMGPTFFAAPVVNVVWRVEP